MEQVSIVSCPTYELEAVYLAVKKAIEDIGFELPENKKILIKPNLVSQNSPNQHTITHYALIDALCRLCQERNNEIYIGESIAFFQRGLTKKAFVTSKIDKVARKYQARLVEFEKCRLAKIDIGPDRPDGLRELYMPAILSEVDLIIDACKLKTHSATRFSGAIKNMFGCLPGGYKQKIHQWVNSEFELGDVFIDIHQNIKPTLSVMDAIFSLDGGPTALGKPVATGVVLASRNPAALDFVAAKMIGYNVDEIPVFIQAIKRGMIKSEDDIQVIGQCPQFLFAKLIKTPLDLPYNNSSIFVTKTFVNLKVRQSKCNGCLECIPSCPVNAITLKDGRIAIDQKRCISCYYCMSVCPKKAIVINPSPMNRLIFAIRMVTRL
ncbi:MAG: DUF362 domain-containing protein [Erysipelotrichaceae bacterium]|nr:DUF362 domain-containing protein [Erysipelotrichaceae bacterium]